MMNRNFNFQRSNCLIPAIIQEEKTGEVLMLGYMDKKALSKTQKEGFVYFWSRSKQRLWKKGETSGSFLEAKKILVDCDRDTLLIQVELIGTAACHKGTKSCFRVIDHK